MKQVRVLHVASEMTYGGLENVIMNYMRHIDRNKVRFDFLLSKASRGSYEDEIEALGGRIYKIPRSNPIKYALHLNRFFRKYAHEYPIIHLHHVPWGFLTQVLASVYGVKTRILHVHFNKKYSKWSRKKKLAGFIAKKSSTVFFSCSDEAGEAFFGKSHFKVWKNAINASRFDFNPDMREKIRKQFDLLEESLVIGQIGRLSPEKNHRFTLEILKELLTRGVNVKCIFVGDGPCRQDLEDYANSLGVRDNCLFIGAAYNPEDYLQAMDIFIFPSFKEGLGLVAVEAQASGLKCIVSSFVPEECRVSDLVTFLPIKNGVSDWADAIEKERHYDRKGRISEIEKSGYDIVEVVNKLQMFYESKGT